MNELTLFNYNDSKIHRKEKANASLIEKIIVILLIPLFIALAAAAMQNMNARKLTEEQIQQQKVTERESKAKNGETISFVMEQDTKRYTTYKFYNCTCVAGQLYYNYQVTEGEEGHKYAFYMDVKKMKKNHIQQLDWKLMN